MYRNPAEYEDIVNAIIEIYLDYDSRDFPLDEKDICRRLGVALVPYSECPEEARTFQGAARRAEFFRLTHFRMTYKKGTV